MTVTFDASALTLAALMAALVAHTTLTLSLRISDVGARRRTCAVLLGALALGFGSWSLNFVQSAPEWLIDRPSVALSSALLSLGIAVSSRACALFFLARRDPDNSSLLGSAFALATGLAVSRKPKSIPSSSKARCLSAKIPWPPPPPHPPPRTE